MPGNLVRQRHEPRQTVDELRRHPGLFSYKQNGQTAESGPQSGLSAQLGIRPGGIVEWLVAREGAGAVTLALQVMAQSSGSRGVWAVVDPARECYCPCFLWLGNRSDAEYWFSARPLFRKHAGRSSNACVVPVYRPHGHGSTNGFPRGFIVAGKWRRKWEEAWACFFGRSQARREPIWADLRLLVTPRAGGQGETRRIAYRSAVSPGRPRRQRPGVGDRPCRGSCASGSRSGQSNDCGPRGPSLDGRSLCCSPAKTSDL